MIRSMKRKGLVLALVAAMAGSLLPMNMDKVHAATASTSSTQVKAKTYSKKDGRYSVNVKQAKVDYKTVNVYIPGVKTLKKVKGTKKVYKVKATAYMYCDKQVTKQKSKTVKLSSISSSKKYFTMSAPAMGKYNFVVKYYNKRGKTLRTVTVKNAGVIAQEYNIAILSEHMVHCSFLCACGILQRVRKEIQSQQRLQQQEKELITGQRCRQMYS